jgi:hypothetical protein
MQGVDFKLIEEMGRQVPATAIINGQRFAVTIIDFDEAEPEIKDGVEWYPASANSECTRLPLPPPSFDTASDSAAGQSNSETASSPDGST